MRGMWSGLAVFDVSSGVLIKGSIAGESFGSCEKKHYFRGLNRPAFLEIWFVLDKFGNMICDEVVRPISDRVVGH